MLQCFICLSTASPGTLQVWVGSVSRGPNNSQLLGTYEHAETFAYQDEIGQILLTICKVKLGHWPSQLLSYQSSKRLSAGALCWLAWWHNSYDDGLMIKRSRVRLPVGQVSK